MGEARNWKTRTRGPRRWPHPRQTATGATGIGGGGARGRLVSSRVAAARWRARRRKAAARAREELGSALFIGARGQTCRGTHT
jgi:hypothetical protein